MDLKQIRYFVTVVEEGSINQAARKLHMTQPPVSKQMQLLEDEAQVIRAEGASPASGYRLQVNRDFRDEIDLRGLMGDEGWQAVDKYLDEAMVAGFTKVRLIHGKGTGALKNAIWQHLKKDARVASFRLGQYGEGDGGVTVVELK